MMTGEKHYISVLNIQDPEIAHQEFGDGISQAQWEDNILVAQHTASRYNDKGVNSIVEREVKSIDSQTPWVMKI